MCRHRKFQTVKLKFIIDGQRLIGLGAVDLIVPSVLPVGCFPLYLTLSESSDPADYGRRTGCLTKFNALSWYHNVALRRQLDQLRKKYPAVSIRYADFYAQIFDFVINPLKYGGFLISKIILMTLNVLKSNFFLKIRFN